MTEDKMIDGDLVVAGPTFDDKYEKRKELWERYPSFQGKIETKVGNQYIIASGWHLRQLRFEKRHLNLPEQLTGEPVVRPIEGATEASFSDILQSAMRFEVEISLDQVPENEAAILDLLRMLPLSREESACSESEIISGIKNMAERPSANAQDHDSNLDYCDFLNLNLPARKIDSDDLQFFERWCRVYLFHAGTVTIYKAFAATKDNKHPNLRWPHNGIWLNRESDFYTTKDNEFGQSCEALLIPVKYLEYNLKNWQIEFETWLDRPFETLTQGDVQSAADKHAKTQTEIGVLSRFISRSYKAWRNIERRLENNNSLKGLGKIKDEIKTKNKEIETLLSEARISLTGASQLVANAAQSVQALATQESAKLAERNNVISSRTNLIIAMFLLPTLVISFYSMSVVKEDGQWTWPMGLVLILCIVSLVLVIPAIAIWRKRIDNKSKTSKQRSRQN